MGEPEYPQPPHEVQAWIEARGETRMCFDSAIFVDAPPHVREWWARRETWLVEREAWRRALVRYAPDQRRAAAIVNEWVSMRRALDAKLVAEIARG